MVRAAALPLAIVAVACALAAATRLGNKPGDVVEPELVIPGEWQTDASNKYLFLSLSIPKSISLKQCKVMTNGDSLLVVVTQRPEEEPDTNAMRKYKMVVEAIKGEVGHDEALLSSKLQTWLETEDDDEVRAHVQEALDSLNLVRQAKKNDDPRILKIPIMLDQQHSFLARSDASNATHAHVALPAIRQQRRGSVGIVKESFAVEIPYPVPQERIFLLQTAPTTLVAGMPLVRESLEASGVSTGGKAFSRVPVFDTRGQLLAGAAPPGGAGAMTTGLNLQALGEFRPLTA